MISGRIVATWMARKLHQSASRQNRFRNFDRRIIMAGKKPGQTRKAGSLRQDENARQARQQQGELEEFESQQGEIREQDYADEIGETHKQQRGTRD